MFHPCPIHGCNRKYKQHSSLKKHILKIHPLETRTLKGFALQTESRIALLRHCIAYAKKIQNLRRQWTHDELVRLLPHLQIPSKNDLERVERAHNAFQTRVIQARLLSQTNWERALSDFQVFLNLGLPYYDDNFCPTLAVDFVWHAVMMEAPIQYQAMCVQACGRIIPHCARDRTKKEDEERFVYYLKCVPVQPHVPGDGSSALYLEQALMREELRQKEALLEKEKRFEQERLEQEAWKVREMEEQAELKRFHDETGLFWIRTYGDYAYYYKEAFDQGDRDAVLLNAAAIKRGSQRRESMASSC